MVTHAISVFLCLEKSSLTSSGFADVTNKLISVESNLQEDGYTKGDLTNNFTY